MFYGSKILVDGLTLCGCGHHIDVCAFRSEYHESDTEYGIGTCCEYLQLHIATVDREAHLGTFRTSDPVALCLFERVGPVECIQTVEQTLRVGRHSQTPLVHDFLFHRITSAYRQTFRNLIVGQYCSELRTPVYHRISEICQTPVHKGVGLLFLVHRFPLVGSEAEFFGSCRVESFGAIVVEMLTKFVDRTGLAGFGIIPAAEHAYECPLCPAVIFRIACAYLAVPVVAETYAVELLAVAGYIL